MGVGAGIGAGALLKRKIPTGGKMGGAYVWVPSLTATHSTNLPVAANGGPCSSLAPLKLTLDNVVSTCVKHSNPIVVLSGDAVNARCKSGAAY